MLSVPTKCTDKEIRIHVQNDNPVPLVYEKRKGQIRDVGPAIDLWLKVIQTEHLIYWDR